MNVNDALRKSIRLLTRSGLADQPGILLYSGISTLRKGRLYFLGTNPGGVYSRTVRQTLSDIEADQNEYLDGHWGQPRGGPNELRDNAGSAPMQQRVQFLFKQLGFQPRRVAASNLIFKRTISEADIDGMGAIADECWPVHSLFLSIIQPKIILCTGNTAFDYILEHVRASRVSPEIKRFSAEWANWKCQTFDGPVEQRQTRVIGIPHLGRYDIIPRQRVVNRLKRLVAEY